MSVFRLIWRSPGFMAAAVLTLALGIGVSVTCFGVVRAVLMKPLGYCGPRPSWSYLAASVIRTGCPAIAVRQESSRDA